MTHYQLAKIVQAVGKVDARKRLQKLIYLLQCAGCPLKVEFTLHLYGPYSHEIANLTDELVADHLLAEKCDQNRAGRQYSYQVSPKTVESLAEFERTEQGKSAKKAIAPWEDKIKDLAGNHLWTLELASTVAFFKQSERSWEKAVEETALFKNVDPANLDMLKALKLAKSVLS